MRVLVTGGAGYIGAHTVHQLRDRGDEVVVIDDLVSGDPARIPGIPLLQLELADSAAPDAVAAALHEHRIEAVIHFAARKQVAESVARPAWYYQQNVGGLANLLLGMERAGAGRLVFSSSATVYGVIDGPIDETDATEPQNPYGATKLIGERLAAAASAAWPLAAASLRYFNVAGASRPELADTSVANLVPIVLRQLAAGETPQLNGDDYPTPDGTCLRDYVHVADVAAAHLTVLDRLDPAHPGHVVYNVGTGAGTSVREMVDRILAVAGSELEPVVRGRRAGDPATLVAKVDRIREATGWTASHDLDDIVRSAWEASGLSAR